MAGGDPVITFACCWIAFNAFYAQDTADSTSTLERGLYRNYFYKISEGHKSQRGPRRRLGKGAARGGVSLRSPP